MSSNLTSSARLLHFIAQSNIFIALCAASLSIYTQLLFQQTILISLVILTFSATFLLYNTQRLFLSWLQESHQRQDWYRSHTPILAIFMFLSLPGLYPLVHASLKNLIIYTISLGIGLLYFLPFSNLRRVPFLKSLVIGLVWGLVCVATCVNVPLTFFCAQVCLITALCILFNIRDLDHDKASKTPTLPVVWGIRNAKIITLALLITYLLCNFSVTATVIFATACVLTVKAQPKKHPFYYFYGVDGLILLQTLIAYLRPI